MDKECCTHVRRSVGLVADWKSSSWTIEPTTIKALDEEVPNSYGGGRSASLVSDSPVRVIAVGSRRLEVRGSEKHQAGGLLNG